MRIVNLKTFLTLPEGTLFTRYQPCVFDGLEIKGRNCGEIGFFLTTLFPPWPASESSEEAMNILDAAEKDGGDFPLGPDRGSRDGCFVEDQLFGIFSADDTKALIAALQKTLPT